MNAKEKAERLVIQMYQPLPAFDAAKQCALIAVKFAKENPLNSDGYNKYLDEVKQEVENIKGDK
jgi:hypothetical protein